MRLNDKFLVIVGTQSSGSSAIAGVAYHIGVWMGTRLTGRYGSRPDRKCGFEDAELTRLVRHHCPFLCESLHEGHLVAKRLHRRVQALRREASEHGTMAGCKLPRFSFLAEHFLREFPDGLHVIGCERPLEDSIRSVQRILPKVANWPERIQWLHEGKERFLAQLPPERTMRVPYYDVLAAPEEWARKIAAWLGLQPTSEQIAKALKIVRPKMRHV